MIRDRRDDLERESEEEITKVRMTTALTTISMGNGRADDVDDLIFENDRASGPPTRPHFRKSNFKTDLISVSSLSSNVLRNQTLACLLRLGAFEEALKQTLRASIGLAAGLTVATSA